jgi:hypothetical protein
VVAEVGGELLHHVVAQDPDTIVDRIALKVL